MHQEMQGEQKEEPPSIHSWAEKHAGSAHLKNKEKEGGEGWSGFWPHGGGGSV